MTSEALTDYSNHIRRNKDGRNSLWLAVEGMNCAGCAFKIEKALNTGSDINARVNVTEKRLTLVWDGNAQKGNELVGTAAGLGFRFSPVREKDAADQSRLRELLRAMAVAGFASGNLMIFSLALWFSPGGGMDAGTRDLMHWYSALIALPATVYAGMPFFRSAGGALRAWRTNMDVPISVAVILAACMSLFETVRGGAYVFFDSAVMLLFILLVGRYLDARARAQARNAAEDLVSLMAGNATVIDGAGLSVRVPASAIRPGMVLYVAKGEKILADGVACGEGQVDASALTGETLPQAVSRGDKVMAGMLNIGDALSVDVEKAQNDSVMSDIIALMQKAEQDNAKSVRLADRIAGWYTPVVHVLAVATFMWWLQAGSPWQQALLYAITVLVITCPCALGLAVPVAQFVAGKRLFSQGMLLKSGDALERLADVDTIIFDKTGTLTSGALSLENDGALSREDLALASALAASSRHPLAIAAAALSKEKPISGAREIPGKGVEAVVEGKTVRLGSAAFTGAVPTADDKMELWLDSGDRASKRLAFLDRLHDDVRDTISALPRDCHVTLLSGDRTPVAARIAGMAGIGDWHAEIDPVAKCAFIEAEIAKGHRVLMVGDGLNDAAALMRATVSMSPSTALDITQNAADIVYCRKGISSVLRAINIARSTRGVVRQNFAMALGYNIVAIPLACAGYVTPLIAAAAMSASSLVVILNALRIGKG